MGKMSAEYYRAYYHKRRLAIIEYLGGKCVKCDSVENLEVDHRDRKEKSFRINFTMSLKNELFLSELAKCQVLCEFHHLEKTINEKDRFSHGTTYGWMKTGCVCKLCSLSKLSFYDRRNKKRRELGSENMIPGPYHR